MEKYAQVSNGQLHYLDWNEQSTSTPIVLLHGFSQTCHSWDEFSQRISSEYRVIALDQRGHGNSFHDPDCDYSRDKMVQDFAQFVEHVWNRLLMPQVVINC
eukprot:TRINITY_DN2692_c0_g1_i3.p1 TRINITY_DN2692_c0_g1~~TRINITY_DN2692_c0_g1_i3.p1  ORF type:complete len:101 (+),score=9.01 TRINITY_DN2692_c0_g1_i3:16-318(+)